MGFRPTLPTIYENEGPIVILTKREKRESIERSTTPFEEGSEGQRLIQDAMKRAHHHRRHYHYPSFLVKYTGTYVHTLSKNHSS